MKIQLNTDNNITGTESFETFINERISATLKHMADHVTRVEVHLSDQNADKGGKDDIQCKMEARVQGLQPVSVLAKSSTKEKALDGALDKLKATLTTRLGKLKNK